MPMPPYPIYCYQKGCGKPAEFKIAALWSDGVTHELKTYALTCGECLPEFFRQSRTKNADYRRAPGETLGCPASMRCSAAFATSRFPDGRKSSSN